MNQEPTPSVGRIVHYVSYGTPNGEYRSQDRAAVISEVPDHESDTIHLVVLNPTGLFFNLNVVHDEDDKRGGTWHWPERV